MSNETRQLRYGTSYTVEFPDFPSFNVQPKKFRLVQEQGKHDVLELTFPVINPFFLKSFKTGALVRLKWKTGRASGEFVGHLYSVRTVTQSTQTRDTIITCMGTGFALKEGGAKVWNNKTASEIVTDISKTAKLKPIVTQSPVRFAQQSMTGHSYWEKIQELAQRVGYVAQIYGVELHFHPIDKMIDAFISNIPVLSFQDAFYNSGTSIEGQTLDVFKPLVGDIHEAGKHTKKDKIVSGIDSTTGKSFSHVASPSKVGKNLKKKATTELFQEIVPSRIVETPAEAKAMAEAFAQLGRFSIHAEGQAQGDPRIAPYKTVEINGTGDFTDGFWVVDKAVHTGFMDGRYICEFTCMTDGLGENKSSGSRPVSAITMSGTRNIPVENVTGIKVKSTPARISAPSQIFNQGNSSYKAFPRKWVG